MLPATVFYSMAEGLAALPVWLAIWLFIRMVIGWVRLLVRLGKRWCRKEIAA